MKRRKTRPEASDEMIIFHMFDDVLKSRDENTMFGLEPSFALENLERNLWRLEDWVLNLGFLPNSRGLWILNEPFLSDTLVSPREITNAKAYDQHQVVTVEARKEELEPQVAFQTEKKKKKFYEVKTMHAVETSEIYTIFPGKEMKENELEYEKLQEKPSQKAKELSPRVEQISIIFAHKIEVQENSSIQELVQENSMKD
ncbi:hypothetical protein Syun_026291 [Stephania yunnanensis]|uniref:Uncharacterized protein n=1 Tax=Stephania yunnanensis TaxID=152371 RepID=A0AAP0ET78_9MAGN